MNDKQDTNETTAQAPGGGLKKLLIMGAAGVVLVGAGGFGVPALKNMLSPPPPADEEAAPEAAPASDERPALYASLQPPMVVNFRDSNGESHYMQVTMEVMAREQFVIDAVRKHVPAIRNSLILLFSSDVDYELFNTRARKEQMLADALVEIRKVMRERIGVDGVEAVYFTSLVVQ